MLRAYLNDLPLKICIRYKMSPHCWFKFPNNIMFTNNISYRTLNIILKKFYITSGLALRLFDFNIYFNVIYYIRICSIQGRTLLLGIVMWRIKFFQVVAWQNIKFSEHLYNILYAWLQHFCFLDIYMYTVFNCISSWNLRFY